jgi:hypothetical protein
MSRRFFEVAGPNSSEVVLCQTGPLCDPGQHPRTDFFIIMKCENEVRPAVSA